MVPEAPGEVPGVADRGWRPQGQEQQQELGSLLGVALPIHTLHSPKSPCRRKVLSTDDQLDHRGRAWVALGSSEGVSG